MSVYLDRKYLLMVSSRLDKFTTKEDDLFNFRCPFCGDSRKNPNKARGYVHRKDDDYFFKCHNCNKATNFSGLLKFVDDQQHKAYVLEKFASNNTKLTVPKKECVIVPVSNPSNKLKNIGDFKDSIDTLPDGHYAKEYIRARCIPENFFNEIFYVENYKDWLDINFPTHGKEDVPNDARIVLFFTDQNGGITNITGRSLAADQKLRYVTVKIRDDNRKIFGTHRLDRNKRVYITEGQFDSFFLPNAIASGDSNLFGLADFLRLNDVVLVFDNQPRNKEIVKQIKRAIDSNFSVALLPYDADVKDINEMVRAGMKPADVVKLIDDHVYNGLTAQLQFNNWRKC